MKIAGLVLGLLIAVAIICFLVYRAVRNKRIALLFARWQNELPNLTYQFRFVPPRPLDLTGAVVRGSMVCFSGPLSPRDFGKIAIMQLSLRGVDPATLTAEQRETTFDEEVDFVASGYMFSDEREGYSRLVRRAYDVLEGRAGGCTRQQEVAAELLLTKPYKELVKVGQWEWEAKAYFQKLCAQAAAATVSEAKAKTIEAASAGTKAGSPLREAMEERILAAQPAANIGADVAEVHRVLPANCEGKVAAVIKQVDAVSEETLSSERQKVRDPGGLAAFRQRLYPLAWAGIAKEDLSLAEAVRVCSVLGLEASELGVQDLEERYRAARSAEGSNVSGVDPWADFVKAGELAASCFDKLKALWKIVGTRYEPCLGTGFSGLEISSQPEGALFSMSFLVLDGGHWYKVLVRQLEPDAALIYDSGHRRWPFASAVLLWFTGDESPSVVWRALETEDLDAMHTATHFAGLDKELHISLDGSQAPDGLPGGPRSAVVRRDRISGKIKGIEARGPQFPEDDFFKLANKRGTNAGGAAGTT